MSLKSPNPTDVFVGSRIRIRRNMIGMSQERLAGNLGVTFQQVQKYEKGTNRVGASRLQAIATTLAVPISFFFQQEHGGVSLDGIEGPSDERAISNFLATKEGVLLNHAFLKIKDTKIRRSVVALTKALGNAEGLASSFADDDADEGERPSVN
ncbi:helix-turn-helix transcriptional regulator (plasmid) [Rhizobium sp. TH2]|uniref:helix-turn-helix domain-containing protein n=1 Tax=Rhizobium sp. TH2 TaxID=2775403 RepID=UPI0021577EAC|nr:helix-turn-helix transcriptional regulator [Rhizobium sp. TH2]UVC12318.1 helix-turn-helix transcriptional regulator [Rhizobium sp. TH2]